MKIELPEDVSRIIRILTENGYKAHAVGGCVRDMFLGREPKDWDITTSARPEEIKALFHKTVDTGIQHGTVTVMMHHIGYEVTTYRIDGEYRDSRHPETVTFTTDISEDLRRRDFTINAMAYNEEDGVIDLFCGQEDLKAGVIRAVGVPEERFTEDALRIMRGVRFAAQLGFTVEAETFSAMKKLSYRLSDISKERIRDEFLKTLESAHPEDISVYETISAMPYILDCYRGSEALQALLKRLPEDKCLRLAVLFMHLSDDAEENARTADLKLKALRFDNETKNRTVHLVKMALESVDPAPEKLRVLASRIGKEHFLSVMTLVLADRPEEKERILQAEEDFRKMLEAGVPLEIRDLKLNGKDLMALGVQPGKDIGETLNMLLAKVLEKPEKNSREALEELVREKNIG